MTPAHAAPRAATAPSPARFQELDAFRGIAAMLVAVFHFTLRYQIDYGAQATAPAWVIDALAVSSRLTRQGGNLPVYWFFMISGFVIVWTLERCRDWRDFAVSRFSRLYPAYWAAAIVTFTLGSLAPLPGQTYSVPQFLANLTMLHELFNVASIDGAYWSLFVELIFYVAMGALFAIRRMHWLHVICLLWAIGCATNALLPRFGSEIPWTIQRFALLRHGHFLAAGVMFFQIWTGRRVGFAYAVIAVCLVSIAAAYTWQDMLACVLFFALFQLALLGRLRFLANPALLWLGGISYPLYVCHQLTGMRLMAALESAGASRALAALAALAAVLLLAHAISRLVERPAMHLIRTAWRRRARA